MFPGEEKAWAALLGLDPTVVARAASVRYDPESRSYLLRSLGCDYRVDTARREIASSNTECARVLERHRDLLSLSVLWYLVSSKDVPLSGRLVRPSGLKGGEGFFAGTHALPLGDLASRYANDTEGFLYRGRQLDGERAGYGDASIVLRPVPRVPTILILWLGDAEFPPRADLLLDSTCETQLPLDIIWSVSMMAVLSMYGE